nr:hypothetical protein BaRGS_023586 [Batillaria attramentaria]
MLRRIWDNFHLPVLVLTDSDPHGVEIMLVYKYGSKLEEMIQTGVKAELQCLDSVDTSFLSSVYLPNKIHAGDWI